MSHRIPRHRVDEELVRQGFFKDADTAMRAVLSGDVSTTNRKILSAGELVPEGIYLQVKGTPVYVSRGGLKLERAFEAFQLDVVQKRCLDIGCSTGGFTDCLLQYGAALVTSVDVGYAQFDWSLRNDDRVELLERTNVVNLPQLGYNDVFDVAVSDVSFTSVITILPAVLEVLKQDGIFVTLVKPQFEAKKEDVGAGGIVTDPTVRLQVLQNVTSAFTDAKLGPLGVCESPIHGAKGNVEYLLFGQCNAEPRQLNLESVVYEHSVQII